MVLGLEPTTFRAQVSSHNHQTRAPAGFNKTLDISPKRKLSGEDAEDDWQDDEAMNAEADEHGREVEAQLEREHRGQP